MEAVSVPPALTQYTKAQIQSVRLSRSFARYIPAVWSTYSPKPFLDNWHVGALAEHLQAVADRQILKLIISISPRVGKSSIVSCLWPTWVWTRTPEARFLTGSYKLALAQRDANWSRRLVASKWYQERWGHMFRLTGDQNTKSLYENNKGGRRLIAGVEAGTTGEGGDFLCLDGGTLIETDEGRLPIQTIVDRRLNCRVLGSSGRWQTITEWYRYAPRPMIELTTADGATLRCTEDHPIWVEGQGYVPAKDVIYSKDAVFLRRLWQEVRSSTGPRRPEQARFGVFPQVLGQEADRGREPVMGRGVGYAGLLELQEGVQVEAVRSQAAEVLLSSVPVGSLQSRAAEAMCGVRGTVLSKSVMGEVLLAGLLEQGSPVGDPRHPEWPVQARARPFPLHAGFPEDLTPADLEERWAALRDLWPGQESDQDTRHSPSRWVQDEPCADEPRDSVSVLPSEGPCGQGNRRRWDEAIRLVAVRRCEAPAAVFNLTCSPDHDYYANGLLAHNCMDDPLDIEAAMSLATRETAWDYMDNVWRSRLDPPGTDGLPGAMLLTAQRTHEDDPTGHLLKEGGWEHLCIAEEHEVPPMVEVTKIGWRDPRKLEGELLWPARRSYADVAILKRNPYKWATLYQQRPAPLEGGIIKRHWWRFWTPRCSCLKDAEGEHAASCPANLPVVRLGKHTYIQAELPEEFDEHLQSWDMNFKGDDEDGADPGRSRVSGGVWARAEAQFYLLDLVGGEWGFNETEAQLVELSYKWKQAKRKLVEDKANGPAIMARLKRKLGGFVPVTPRLSKVGRVTSAPTDADKKVRALSMEGTILAGDVYLPHPALAPYVWDYIEEHALFPNGPHEDMVDQTSQAISDMSTRVWGEAQADHHEAMKLGPEGPPLTTHEIFMRQFRNTLKEEREPATMTPKRRRERFLRVGRMAR